MARSSGWRPDYWAPLDEETQEEIERRAEPIFERLLQILGSPEEDRAETARAEILHAAELLVSLGRVKDSAPPIRSVRRDLQKIKSRVSQAADLLEGLPHPAFHALRRAGMPVEDLDALDKGKEAPLASILRTLAQWTDSADVELASQGDAAWTVPTMREFVVECLVVFERYRPGEASSKAKAWGGDFHEFVSLTYHIATGQQAPDLESTIKRVVAYWNRRRREIENWERSPEGRYNRHLENLSRVREIEFYLAAPGPPKEDFGKHRAELEARKREIAGFKSGGHDPPEKS